MTGIQLLHGTNSLNATGISVSGSGSMGTNVGQALSYRNGVVSFGGTSITKNGSTPQTGIFHYVPSLNQFDVVVEKNVTPLPAAFGTGTFTGDLGQQYAPSVGGAFSSFSHNGGFGTNGVFAAGSLPSLGTPLGPVAVTPSTWSNSTFGDVSRGIGGLTAFERSPGASAEIWVNQVGSLQRVVAPGTIVNGLRQILSGIDMGNEGLVQHLNPLSLGGDAAELTFRVTNQFNPHTQQAVYVTTFQTVGFDFGRWAHQIVDQPSAATPVRFGIVGNGDFEMLQGTDDAVFAVGYNTLDGFAFLEQGSDQNGGMLGVSSGVVDDPGMLDSYIDPIHGEVFEGMQFSFDYPVRLEHLQVAGADLGEEFLIGVGGNVSSYTYDGIGSGLLNTDGIQSIPLDGMVLQPGELLDFQFLGNAGVGTNGVGVVGLIVSPVPEPESGPLLLIATLLMAGWRRKR